MKTIRADAALEELLHASAETVQREDRAGGDGPKTGGDLLETAAALASRTCRESGVESKRCFAHRTADVGPQKGLVGRKSHRASDWALRPMNNILCGGRKARTARMGDYPVRVTQNDGANKAMERTGRRRPCQHISADPFADQGHSLPPPGPPASLSPFRCCYDSGKSENPGLDSAAVMGVTPTTRYQEWG